MPPGLRQSFVIAGLISGIIYFVLLGLKLLFPGLVPDRLDIGVALLLFAVAFLPRALTWLIAKALDRRRRRS